MVVKAYNTFVALPTMFAVKLDERVAILALQNILFVLMTSTTRCRLDDARIDWVRSHRPNAEGSRGYEQTHEKESDDPLRGAFQPWKRNCGEQNRVCDDSNHGKCLSR
jgi:hypothetical protein